DGAAGCCTTGRSTLFSRPMAVHLLKMRMSMVQSAVHPPRGRVRGERLETRVTADQKSLIERAASLQGRTVMFWLLRMTW
ncbi:DUF1778 domain-containing protein, partial [Rhizobium ruizarguesonis]